MQILVLLCSPSVIINFKSCYHMTEIYTHVQHLSPFFRVTFRQFVLLPSDPGIVNTHVDSAVFVTDQLEHVQDVGLAAEVTVYRTHLTGRSGFLHFLLDGLYATMFTQLLLGLLQCTE